MSAAPINTPTENDLLVPFEQQNIPAEYREYYQIRRGNFFSSIQRFSEIWRHYMLLDKIWLREFEDLKPSIDLDRAFPLTLFMNAHAKVRISIELAFSGCMAEARSIMRDAIEFVALAHHMLKDHEYQKIWLSKNDDQDAFDEQFWDAKRTRLFAGLDELYKVWCQLSETGSHANLNAMCDRSVIVKSETHVELRLNYTGLDEKMWATSLFSLLLNCFKMEETLFKDYRTRFQFDGGLLSMRGEFDRHKEQLRWTLVKRYDLKPPESAVAIP